MRALRPRKNQQNPNSIRTELKLSRLMRALRHEVVRQVRWEVILLKLSRLMRALRLLQILKVVAPEDVPVETVPTYEGIATRKITSFKYSHLIS